MMVSHQLYTYEGVDIQGVNLINNLDKYPKRQVSSSILDVVMFPFKFTDECFCIPIRKVILVWWMTFDNIK